MRMEVHLAIFVCFVFLVGIAFGFTAKILWQYKQFLVAGIAGYFVFIVSKKIWMGALAGAIAYFIAGAIL